MSECTSKSLVSSLVPRLSSHSLPCLVARLSSLVSLTPLSRRSSLACRPSFSLTLTFSCCLSPAAPSLQQFAVSVSRRGGEETTRRKRFDGDRTKAGRCVSERVSVSARVCGVSAKCVVLRGLASLVHVHTHTHTRHVEMWNVQLRVGLV